MNKTTKNGILSKQLLDLSEEQLQLLLEQHQETKPSRLERERKIRKHKKQSR